MIEVSLLFFAIGALSSLLLRSRPSLNRRASHILSALGCAALLFASVSCLLNGPAPEITMSGFSVIPAFRFGFPPLSALFTALIAALGFVSGIYGISYSQEYESKAGRLGFFYNIFIPAMALVPASQNAFSFLFCWEVMTLASFFLVMLEHEKPESQKAGYVYFVMSHAGTAFIFLMFFLLHTVTGSWEFEVFKTAGPHLPANLKNTLFLSAFIGFGTKAGIIPLHLWLPYAHPAAPSHVSALMSGVMIKTAVYGLLLSVFSFLGGGPLWLGMLVLSVGAVSGVIGVLYALMENDIKRMLAFSSVENVGIILIGTGTGMIFASYGMKNLAFIAICAGLYHTVNHAAFKGLLFLGAGSVIKTTHTRNMEELGGLIKTMPVTAFYFLIGSLAISAIPPFNGFISEWLTFQALLSGMVVTASAAKFLCVLAAAALALTGGLAAACFVKAFGITFLALPRSERAKNSKEPLFPEKLAMSLLAAGCVTLGLFPGTVLNLIKPAAESLGLQAVTLPPGGQTAATANGSVSPLTLLVLLTACAATGWAAARTAGGKAKIRYAQTWGCGFPKLTPSMEYTAGAFSKPFRMLFNFIYRPKREIIEDCPAGPYFPASIRYDSKVTYVIKDRLYRPSLHALLKASHVIRGVQAGSVNLYLSYISASLAILLGIFLWMNR